MSKRKKPFGSVVAWSTVLPLTSLAGFPVASRRFTKTPPMPGVAPSAAETSPDPSRSRQMRLPTLKGLKKPKSTVRFERMSAAPWAGPSPRSPVGSLPGPRFTRPEQTPVVPGVALSMPLSVESMSAFGLASVIVEEAWPPSAPAPPKLVRSTQTLKPVGASPSNRKNPFESVVAWATAFPKMSFAGLPPESTRLTFTPAAPGVAPSAPLIVPELSMSSQTRLPRLKG